MKSAAKLFFSSRAKLFVCNHFFFLFLFYFLSWRDFCMFFTQWNIRIFTHIYTQKSAFIVKQQQKVRGNVPDNKLLITHISWELHIQSIDDGERWMNNFAFKFQVLIWESYNWIITAISVSAEEKDDLYLTCVKYIWFMSLLTFAFHLPTSYTIRLQVCVY